MGLFFLVLTGAILWYGVKVGMCTVALFFHVFPGSPVVIAANRDEYFSRPSADPQVLFVEPWVFGGKDLRAGGTWLGFNRRGMIVGIVNRRKENAEPKPGLRSRGLLCLDVLRMQSLREARKELQNIRASDYQPFTLFFTDGKEAYASYNVGGSLQSVDLERGLHVIGNTSLYDPRSEKMNHAYGLFSELQEAFGKNPVNSSRISLIRSALGTHIPESRPANSKDAICVHSQEYGTVSSSIVFYTGGRSRKDFSFFHASGPPCRESFRQLWPARNS